MVPRTCSYSLGGTLRPWVPAATRATAVIQRICLGMVFSQGHSGRGRERVQWCHHVPRAEGTPEVVCGRRAAGPSLRGPGACVRRAWVCSASVRTQGRSPCVSPVPSRPGQPETWPQALDTRQPPCTLRVGMRGERHPRRALTSRPLFSARRSLLGSRLSGGSSPSRSRGLRGPQNYQTQT